MLDQDVDPSGEVAPSSPTIQLRTRHPLARISLNRVKKLLQVWVYAFSNPVSISTLGSFPARRSFLAFRRFSSPNDNLLLNGFIRSLCPIVLPCIACVCKRVTLLTILWVVALFD